MGRELWKNNPKNMSPFCIHFNNKEVGETEKVIWNSIKFNLSPACVLATSDMDSISSWNILNLNLSEIAALALCQNNAAITALSLSLSIDGLVHFIVTLDTEVDKAACNHPEKLKQVQQHRPQWRRFQTVPEDKNHQESYLSFDLPLALLPKA